MASDSVRALAEAAAQVHSVAVRSKGPARPFLAGVGLDRPFFDDKNRAFWVLQSTGWTGFFFLRAISGLANSLGAMFIIHTLLLTATGYSLTLLMASLYRRLIVMRALWTVVISLGTVVIAAAAFSFIETWSLATFINPEFKPAGMQFSARLSSISRSWPPGPHFITGSTTTCCWKKKSTSAFSWKARRARPSSPCCAIS